MRFASLCQKFDVVLESHWFLYKFPDLNRVIALNACWYNYVLDSSSCTRSSKYTPKKLGRIYTSLLNSERNCKFYTHFSPPFDVTAHVQMPEDEAHKYAKWYFAFGKLWEKSVVRYSIESFGGIEICNIHVRSMAKKMINVVWNNFGCRCFLFSSVLHLIPNM